MRWNWCSCQRTLPRTNGYRVLRSGRTRNLKTVSRIHHGRSTSGARGIRRHQAAQNHHHSRTQELSSHQVHQPRSSLHRSAHRQTCPRKKRRVSLFFLYSQSPFLRSCFFFESRAFPCNRLSFDPLVGSPSTRSFIGFKASATSSFKRAKTASLFCFCERSS